MNRIKRWWHLLSDPIATCADIVRGKDHGPEVAKAILRRWMTGLKITGLIIDWRRQRLANGKIVWWITVSDGNENRKFLVHTISGYVQEQ